MYEKLGKLMATSFLLLGLGIAMVGISNNPDQGATYSMDTGIDKPAGTENKETISSHRNSNPEPQNVFDRDRKKKERPENQA